MRKIWIPVFALMLFGGAFTAEAQTGAPRSLYIVAGGYGSLVAGDGPGGDSFRDVFGAGFGFQGYIGGPLTDHLRAQVGAAGSFYQSKDETLTVQWYTAEARFHADNTPWNPYFLFGLGVAWGAFSDTGVTAPVEDTELEFTFTVGLGVEYYFTELTAVSPEVRIRYLDDGERIDAVPFDLGVNFVFFFE